MLHDLLKESREKRGLSLEYVAAELNVSPETVARWENGSEVPTSQQIASLTMIYELPLRVLIKALKETESTLIDNRPGVHAVPKAGRIMAAIMMQGFFLMSINLYLDFGDPTANFLYRLTTIYLPVMIGTLWMVYNQRYEDNPTQRERNTKIELLYCVVQFSVAAVGHLLHYPFFTAFVIGFNCIHYIHSTNEKHMNRPLLNRF